MLCWNKPDEFERKWVLREREREKVRVIVIEKDEKIVWENVAEKVMKEGKWEIHAKIRKVSGLITMKQLWCSKRVCLLFAGIQLVWNKNIFLEKNLLVSSPLCWFCRLFCLVLKTQIGWRWLTASHTRQIVSVPKYIFRIIDLFGQ